MKPTDNATTSIPQPFYVDTDDMPSDAESMFDAQCYALHDAIDYQYLALMGVNNG